MTELKNRPGDEPGAGEKNGRPANPATGAVKSNVDSVSEHAGGVVCRRAA